MNKYNWKDINYQLGEDDLIKFEKNNLTTVLNVLYAEKEKTSCLRFKIQPKAWKTSYFLNDFKQGSMILSYSIMILQSALLKRITSRHNDDVCCLNWLHSFRTKNKFESHEKVWENKDLCGVGMPSEENMMLKFKKYLKLAKVWCIIYTDLESLIKKVDGYEKNFKRLSTTKAANHIPSGFSISMILSLKSLKYLHGVSRGEDFMKSFVNP